MEELEASGGLTLHQSRQEAVALQGGGSGGAPAPLHYTWHTHTHSGHRATRGVLLG